MLTLRAAAALLAAPDAEALARIAAVCGCGGRPLALDAAACDALGWEALGESAFAVRARVARGPGSLRALLLDVEGTTLPAPLRDVLARLAARMARRTPHLAWLCLAAARRPRRQLALLSWSADRSPPRTVALVVDCDDVVDSDAETLCALAAAAGPDDALTHARWLDVLGRESLTRRFYRGLDGAVTGLAATVSVPRAQRRPSPVDRRALALLCASRLLFLAFLEAKGWLDSDRGFLARTYSECLQGAGRYHARVLCPLFFGTLNTPANRRAPAARRFGGIPFLNGGLFAPTALERRARGATFTDEALGVLFGDVLARYRFTAREDRCAWSEAAVDPEMLGKAFECLMDPAERHATGAYYTPQRLVERVAAEALAHAFTTDAVPFEHVAALLDGRDTGPVAAPAHTAVRERLQHVRVLDPACGSGAFLVYALEALAALAARVGDGRPLSERRRGVLTRSIFGVDVNPTAVWLCELRLWLSVVIETAESDPDRVTPLPNLDRNVRIGDALAGGSFADVAGDGTGQTAAGRSGRAIAQLRERYARSSGARKRAALEALERSVRRAAIDAMTRELERVGRQRRDLVWAAKERDLFGDLITTRSADRERRAALRRQARALRSRLRALHNGGALPFAFGDQFADVAADGGFEVVLGNPPWVRPHAIPLADRARLRAPFTVARRAGWTGGGQERGIPRFGPQVDLAALFVERGVSLAREGGIMAMLLPAKLWRSLSGGGVRQLIADRATVLTIEDWSSARSAFDSATYPSLVVLRRTRRDGGTQASGEIAAATSGR